MTSTIGNSYTWHCDLKSKEEGKCSHGIFSGRSTRSSISVWPSSVTGRQRAKSVYYRFILTFDLCRRFSRMFSCADQDWQVSKLEIFYRLSLPRRSLPRRAMERETVCLKMKCLIKFGDLVNLCKVKCNIFSVDQFSCGGGVDHKSMCTTSPDKAPSCPKGETCLWGPFEFGFCCDEANEGTICI